jgi:hypothetical protein
MWILSPGHAGVIGNERADHLADVATVGDGISMYRSDILNAVKHVNRRIEGYSHNFNQSKEVWVQSRWDLHSTFESN